MINVHILEELPPNDKTRRLSALAQGMMMGRGGENTEAEIVELIATAAFEIFGRPPRQILVDDDGTTHIIFEAEDAP